MHATLVSLVAHPIAEASASAATSTPASDAGAVSASDVLLSRLRCFLPRFFFFFFFLCFCSACRARHAAWQTHNRTSALDGSLVTAAGVLASAESSESEAASGGSVAMGTGGGTSAAAVLLAGAAAAVSSQLDSDSALALWLASSLLELAPAFDELMLVNAACACHSRASWRSSCRSTCART